MTNKGSAAISHTTSPLLVSGGYAKCGQLSVDNVNYVSHRAQNEDHKVGVRTHSQEPREHSSLAESPHQHQSSADCSKSGTAYVITVKKNKKEPLPPQRGVSLLRPHAASDSSFKRYSCPPTGILSYSSSAPSTPCSSAPPVQTFVITGHDPLGWKLQPKGSIALPQARTKRLSLQVPLPVIFPDPNTSPGPTSTSDNPPDQDPSSKNTAKPSHRRHSDSLVFVRSLLAPQPVMTLQELRAVRLHSVTPSYESDDVFSEGNEEEDKGITQPCKIPPPVPEKTAMARQMAQLIALSWQHRTPVTTKTAEENIYASVMKTKMKHSHQTVNHSSLHAKICMFSSKSLNNQLSRKKNVGFNFKFFKL